MASSRCTIGPGCPILDTSALSLREQLRRHHLGNTVVVALYEGAVALGSILSGKARGARHLDEDFRSLGLGLETSCVGGTQTIVFGSAKVPRTLKAFLANHIQSKADRGKGRVFEVKSARSQKTRSAPLPPASPLTFVPVVEVGLCVFPTR